MKNYMLPFLLLFTITNLFSQQDETLFGKNGLRLTGAWGGTSIGLTHFRDEGAVTSGGFLGLEFNKLVLIGFGGMETSESVDFSRNLSGSFDFDCGGFLVQYTPRSHRVLHPKFSFLMGGGEVKVKDGDKDDVFVVQPGLGVELNVFRWFRLSLEAGYRFVSGSDMEVLPNKDLSGLSWEMKFRFGWSWGK